MNLLNLSEIGIIFLFIVFLIYSYKKKNTKILLATLIYGFLLEQITFYQFNAYSYGNFLLFIFDIPLVVILGWSLIIYSAINISNKLNLPPLETALFASLIAINLDIIMETIATNLGFWVWNIKTQFFGVPYDNFFAWFVSIFSFTYLLNKFYKKGKITKLLIIVISSLLILIILDEIWTLIPITYYKYLWWGLFSLIIIKILTKIKLINKDNQLNLFDFLIPLGYMMFFVVLFLYYNLYESLHNFIYVLVIFVIFELVILMLPFSNKLIRS